MDSLTERTDSYGNVFSEGEKKMGKANFSHLARQNIIIIIIMFLILIILQPVTRGWRPLPESLYFLFWLATATITELLEYKKYHIYQ